MFLHFAITFSLLPSNSSNGHRQYSDTARQKTFFILTFLLPIVSRKLESIGSRHKHYHAVGDFSIIGRNRKNNDPIETVRLRLALLRDS